MARDGLRTKLRAGVHQAIRENQRVAERVAREGRAQALEPMPPYERRIVHMALRKDPNVTTQSVGEGERRKVTIIPRA